MGSEGAATPDGGLPMKAAEYSQWNLPLVVFGGRGRLLASPHSTVKARLPGDLAGDPPASCGVLGASVPNALLENQGNGTFVDITSRGDGGGGTSALF